MNFKCAGDLKEQVSLLAKSRSCVDFAEIVCQFCQVFVGVRLRFEKSSPRWRIVGREEIKEIEEDSTEIENQKSKTNTLKQAKKAPGRPHGQPV